MFEPVSVFDIALGMTLADRHMIPYGSATLWYTFSSPRQMEIVMVQQIKVVRKHQRKSAIDDNKTLMQLGARASRQAIKNALSSGVSITYIQDGHIIRQAPDGTTEEIKSTKSQETIKLKELLCHTRT
ncbi:hypothetical protein [Brenneria tiliae]|uniref:hypothetical protein n=1 Tax=Brenneria tiliae TaxID=2914984 RepID=UPI002014C166|nr:hypothetical protein [Brenneria tiliae]MCL2899899.1 hypothetical protein [Brenneria tiliae]MCL2904612.1 hypothetical protein [Brenneria tiliae]